MSTSHCSSGVLTHNVELRGLALKRNSSLSFAALAALSIVGITRLRDSGFLHREHSYR